MHLSISIKSALDTITADDNEDIIPKRIGSYGYCNTNEVPSSMDAKLVYG